METSLRMEASGGGERPVRLRLAAASAPLRPADLAPPFSLVDCVWPLREKDAIAPAHPAPRSRRLHAFA